MTIGHPLFCNINETVGLSVSYMHLTIHYNSIDVEKSKKCICGIFPCKQSN